jgi:hypothetical protein
LRFVSGDGLPETHLSTDGQTLFAGADGSVYAIRLGNWRNVAWSTRLPGRSTHTVNVLAAHGRLFAGTNGYLVELDPGTGRILHERTVSQMPGGWEVRLATDGKMVFAGCHGYAYATRLKDWSDAWTADMPYKSFSNVQLLYANGALYAGSNGTAVQLDTSTGRRLRERAVTRAVGEEVHLATDGRLLAVGCNKFVSGLSLDNNWSTTAWETELRGKLWKEVAVASRNGSVYAVSNGYAHRLDASTGAIKNAMSLSYWANLTGNYNAQVGLGPDDRLFIGMHGYAFRMS